MQYMSYMCSYMIFMSEKGVKFQNSFEEQYEVNILLKNTCRLQGYLTSKWRTSTNNKLLVQLCIYMFISPFIHYKILC